MLQSRTAYPDYSLTPSFPRKRISANLSEPEYFFLPFKGEEQDRLAHMRAGGNDEFFGLMDNQVLR